MTKVKDMQEREYYLQMTAEMGWSRNVLRNQYELTKQLPSDLADKLPQPEELERQIMMELGKEEY